MFWTIEVRIILRKGPINNLEADNWIKIKHRVLLQIQIQIDVTEVRQLLKLVRVKGFNICKTKMSKLLYQVSLQDKVSKRHLHMKPHYQSMNLINGEKISGIQEQVVQDISGIALNQAVKKHSIQQKLSSWQRIFKCHKTLLLYVLMRLVYITESQSALSMTL